jgi:acyl-coenzyme A synthetase/AMP-(fatty) acid ligase
LLDLGLALGSGAAVVPVPREHLRWPRRFVRFLADAQVSQVNGVPSIWRSVLRHEPQLLAELSRVRGVLYSGERFPLPELAQLREALPQARVVNCFGSTESVACTFTEVPRCQLTSDEQLSIGTAEPGSEIQLVDEGGRPMIRPGVIGEIYLRSPALFTGYWNDAAATAEVLVPDPVDARSGQQVYRSGDLAYWDGTGGLCFVGRADSLVKVRGNRVELGELERTLLRFTGVAAAAAVLVQRPADDPLLAAFVVPVDPATGIDELAANDFCARVLPEYMVPQKVLVLPELPINGNGKVDRLTLAALVNAGSHA